jgi:hypothetical protein
MGKASAAQRKRDEGRALTFATVEPNRPEADDIHVSVNERFSADVAVDSTSVALLDAGRLVPVQPCPTAPPLASQDVAFCEFQLRVVGW